MNLKKNMPILGRKIENARKNIKLKTKEVAEILGCSQQTVSAIEKDRAHGKFLVSYLSFLKEKGFDLNEFF